VAAPELVFAHRIKEQVLWVTSRLVIVCEQSGRWYLGFNISMDEILLS